ncbi:MAG TPA: hypothetical protein VD962_10395, partial [Rubricoccaceae bacterium]|nr:hypothetical protein [Rubricoccaceae bacterium]
MPRYRYLLAVCGLLLGLSAAPHAQIVTGIGCTGTPTGHVNWPATNPIWSFDFIRPSQSTGSDGSGLELRNVYYRGVLQMKQAHAPILNVEYDPGGGCTCFRDWSDSEVRFQANNPLPGFSCIANATPGTVRTTCDSNMEGGTGGDVGSFVGVSLEDFGTELVLTTHMSAGWYRYRMKWHFYADGRIWPEYSFSAASATCTSAAHRHHVYWRFDFDINNTPNNDAVSEINPALGSTTTFTNERSGTWGNPAHGVYWTILDAGTGNGYRLVPSSADLLLPADFDGPSPALLDMALLRYVPGVVDDGSPSCAISPSGLGLNNEAVSGQDVVFWYRSGALHNAGNPWECDIVGPML